MINKSPKFKFYAITCLIILTTVLGLVAGCSTGKAKQEIVASVNGESITKDDLYATMVRASGQQAVDSLITKKIIELEAKKQKVTVSEAELEKELEKYDDHYGGREAFIKSLETSGFTLDEVKQDLAADIKVQKLLGPRITVTEEETKAYFEANKASLAPQKQVKASHILVATEELANEIKAKLASGGDFAQLAKEYSIDPGSKNNGGDLGYFGVGEMVKEFDEVAFALNIGQVSAPVKTQFGYHIIKVDAKKDAQAANYEQSKAKITETLTEQKEQTEYQTWMQELHRQYKIENSLVN